MYRFLPILFCTFFSALLGACHHNTDTGDEDAAPEEVQTPVAATTISQETLSDSIVLNATSSFLQDNIVKSSVNGYIRSVNTKVGQYAPAGKVLFAVQTKESKNIGNIINNLDPSFHFSGMITIKAPLHGYVTQLNHQIGDYVQDGEQLAVISDSKSFGFILNVPYEYRPYVTVNKSVIISLPDGKRLNGVVAYTMPTIDSASQTQAVLIKVASTTPIPENLIAKVHIIKSAKSGVPSLPKEAVLTNESQSEFWVMKMIDSVTAVKVPIIKGMETGDRVEIVRPQFAPGDKILVSGNYGLPDTAKVKLVKTLP